jgi:hypothetical protein
MFSTGPAERRSNKDTKPVRGETRRTPAMPIWKRVYIDVSVVGFAAVYQSLGDRQT